MNGRDVAGLDDVDIFAMRVHDAIAANVDLMPGPSGIVERALSSAEGVRRRRRRARLVVALTAATAVGGAVGMAVVSSRRPAP